MCVSRRRLAEQLEVLRAETRLVRLGEMVAQLRAGRCAPGPWLDF